MSLTTSPSPSASVSAVAPVPSIRAGTSTNASAQPGERTGQRDRAVESPARERCREPGSRLGDLASFELGEQDIRAERAEVDLLGARPDRVEQLGRGLGDEDDDRARRWLFDALEQRVRRLRVEPVGLEQHDALPLGLDRARVHRGEDRVTHVALDRVHGGDRPELDDIRMAAAQHAVVAVRADQQARRSSGPRSRCPSPGARRAGRRGPAAARRAAASPLPGPGRSPVPTLRQPYVGARAPRVSTMPERRRSTLRSLVGRRAPTPRRH